MRPNTTYGVPCTSSKKPSRCGPFQKPGATSNTTTGGWTSRMSCAAVVHRSLGSVPARPRPAAE
eukprot:489802-Alexandrium_andersonii.AAC.1